MDHTKALADALRNLRQNAKHWISVQGLREREVLEDADNALAAYDAHPAEAATRENGDLATALRCAEEVRYECQFASMPFPGAWARARLNKIIDFLRALSTHQQQGAENGELVERLRTLMNNLDGATDLPDGWDEVLEDCADALSRAPQPDTVTDVMDFVDPGPMGEGIFKDKHDLVWYAEPLVRAALTAALAARRK